MFRVWDTRELEMHRSGLLFHNGKPFVGLRCWDDEHDEYSDGEKEYRAGVMWGISQAWYLDGSLAYCGRMVWGLWHGEYRHWHKNGRLAVVLQYELGCHLTERQWDENGQLIADMAVEEESQDRRQARQLRVKFRELFGREPEDEVPARELLRLIEQNQLRGTFGEMPR